MNQINFLPESFQRSRRRQERRPAEFLIIAGTLVALAGVWVYSSGPDRALADQSDRLDQRLQEIEQLRVEEGRLYKERSGLEQRLMTARETYQSINATQVLSRLSALTPEPIHILSVELSTIRPKPELKAKPDKKKVGSKTKQLAHKPSVMKLTLAGHAPTDEELVTLIRRLTADPVFSSVALRSSRQDKTKEYFVRAFHLDVTIDLDRRFMADANNGGARHAD